MPSDRIRQEVEKWVEHWGTSRGPVRDDLVRCLAAAWEEERQIAGRCGIHDEPETAALCCRKCVRITADETRLIIAECEAAQAQVAALACLLDDFVHIGGAVLSDRPVVTLWNGRHGGTLAWLRATIEAAQAALATGRDGGK